MTPRSHAAIQSLETRQLLNTDATLSAMPRSVLADMNGDGKADLVALSRGAVTSDAVLTIALGAGDGTFRPSDRVVVHANTGFAMNVGDINNDGKPDVAVAGDNPLSMAPVNGTFVLTALGSGDGKFMRETSSAHPGAPILHTTFVPAVQRARAVTIADLDNNDFAEVSVLGVARTSSTTQALTIVVNWDVTLPTLVAIPPTVIPLSALTSVNQLHTADLDGDGAIDLLATNRTPLPPSLLAVIRPDLVAVRFPSGHTPSVRSGVNPLNAPVPSATIVRPVIETFGLADLDGDASPDLVGRVNTTLRYTSFTGGSSMFGPVTLIVAANQPRVPLTSFLAGDVTGDGLDDVMARSRHGPVLAVNTTVAGGPVSVRWSRVLIAGLFASTEDDQVATYVT